MWEICRRCVINEDDVALDYAPAFAEFLIDAKREPSVEEMRKLIVDHERRPEIPDDWHSDPVRFIFFYLTKYIEFGILHLDYNVWILLLLLYSDHEPNVNCDQGVLGYKSRDAFEFAVYPEDTFETSKQVIRLFKYRIR